MTDEYNELDEFLKSLQENIVGGIKEGFELKGEIEVELAIVKTKKAGGKVQILVAEGGGKYEKEELSKIKFKIGKKKEWAGSIVVHSD